MTLLHGSLHDRSPRWLVWEARAPSARDHRPVLVAPGRALRLWWGSHGPVWCTASRAFAGLGDRVVVWAVSGQSPTVVADAQRTTLLVDRSVAAVLHADGTEVLDAEPGTRRGADVTLVRRDGLWRVRGAAPLPDGARRSPRIHPFPLGRGVLWTDGGFVYRRGPHRVVRSLGPVTPSESLHVGPHGAVAVATEGHLTRAAAPRGPLRALSTPVPLDAPWGWCAEGAGLWLAERGRLTVVPTDGRPHRTERRRGLPVGTRHVLSDQGQLLDHETGEVLGTGWSGGPGATAGRSLVGPGGATWRLSRRGARTEPGALPPGRPIPPEEQGAPWLMLLDEGGAAWLDPRSGALTPLPHTHALGCLAGAVARDGRWWLLDARGLTWRIGRKGRLSARDDRIAPAPPRSPAVPKDPWRGLVSSAVMRGDGRAWAWGPEGLLLELPGRSVSTRRQRARR